MAQMVEELEKSLLEELRCPVCDSYMCAPIRQCLKGHSVCDFCFPQLKTCPKCRSSKSQARSYCLEAVHSKLHVPCRYNYLGCNFVSLGEQIRHHETYCELAANCCPFKNYHNCQWKGITSKLKEHLKKEHASSFCAKKEREFRSMEFRNIPEYQYIYVVFYAYKNFFRFTWDFDEITGMTRWVVYYIGSPENARRYSYKIEFSRGSRSDDISTSLLWKAPCEAMPDNELSHFERKKYLNLHSDFLRIFEDNGSFLYNVSIYRNDSSHGDSNVNNLQ